MPVTSRTVSTRAGILLGGALVLAFSAPHIRAEEAALLAPAEIEIVIPAGSTPGQSTPSVGEAAAPVEESLVEGSLVEGLPEITAAPQTRVSLKRAPRKTAAQKPPKPTKRRHGNMSSAAPKPSAAATLRRRF